MKDQHYRILHLEDLPSDATLVDREIKKTLEKYSIRVVETEADFRNELEAFKPHIVISDYMLPSFDGLSALKIVLQKTPITPVIMLTGSMNEDTAVDCMKAGATDYVIKEHIKRLGPALLNALEQTEIKIEKIRAEKQILLLSKAIEQSPVCVIITDPAGKIEYVNRKFTELTGYSFDEVIGQNPRILKSGKQSKEYYEQMWQTIISGHDWTGEMHNRRKNGEMYWESVSISSIANDKGEIEHFIGIKEDITEKKHILEELVTAKDKAQESDRLKSAFLANMSHEIRTPLNGILGFAELLKKPNLTSEKQQNYLEIMGQSGKRMLDTINSIVDISKIEAGLMSVYIAELNLNEQTDSLYEFFKPMAVSKGLQLSISKGLQANEAIINTDARKFNSILTNLVNNALKFTEKGSIEFGYEKNGEYLEFFVKDTGIGIPKDRLEAIFERFIKADIEDEQAFQGSGLGLAIAKSYVETLGGKLWVESETGNLPDGRQGGTTFYFTLPLTYESKDNAIITQALASKDEEIKMKSEISGLKILVAEDDEVSFSFLTDALDEISSEIILAITGKEAVHACFNNPDIDLVLMDIRMPEMGGYEATSKIRQFNKDVVIIAQTAYGLSGDREKATEAGCNDYISKPVDITLLNELINKHCFK